MHETKRTVKILPSDEFYEEYAIEIAAREGVIENHNIDYDFVNLLLNDVGNTTFYNGYDYSSGGFLENHCPNTFLGDNRTVLDYEQ